MKPKPWVQNKDWFDQYSQAVAKIKNLQDKPGILPKIKSALNASFMRVYRAVAFDIDGTLTKPDEPSIDSRMASLVERLLQRSVPVFLITGRGRGSARSAADEIRKVSLLSDWYFRKLYCITHNGVFLLSTPSDNPSKFLSNETTIDLNGIDNIDDMMARIASIVEENNFGPPHVNVTQEPKSIRIKFDSKENRFKLEKILQSFVSELLENGTEIYLSRGSYAKSSCLDLSGTNKKLAMNYIGQLIGVPQERILRIGDQGQYGGNDFDLLDSSAGFSVQRLSSQPARCFPVLGADLKTQLYGSDATNYLLDLVFLFAPLSITPTNLDSRLRGHSSFEKLAIMRSREEAETVSNRLRIRLKYLINNAEETFNIHNIDMDDIYDRLSGGVKFRDWELDNLPQLHPARNLFEIPTPNLREKRPPQSSWCMYTDTGLLMRGPNYYFGLTQDRENDIIKIYINQSQKFITDASKAITQFGLDNPSLTQYKFVLAIQDNVRNMLLNLLSLAFMVENEIASDLYPITNYIFKDAVSLHSDHHFDFLLNPDSDWSISLSLYNNLLSRINKIILEIDEAINLLLVKIGGITELIKKVYKENDLSKIHGITKIFRWRECDHFLQNITAVQLGLHELMQRPEIRSIPKLVVTGIAYGGIELPAIALTVARKRGYNMGASYVKVSIYSDRENSRKVRAGDHEYINDLLYKTKPICLIDAKKIEDDGNGFILMDDNCTTGVTLQLTRDFLVTQGADVFGAIVVRFPGVNRFVQMAMQGHGFPDPEVLFSFIRGLVAPSPYARLIYQRWKGKRRYLDETKMFDKAKARITRYLVKNGTLAIKGS